MSSSLRAQKTEGGVTTSGEAVRLTEVGNLPASWTVVPLGEAFDVQQGKALSPSARSGHSPRPFLRTANVLWGRLDLRTVDQMDFTDEEVSRLSLKPGDLLVCEGGEIGRTALWAGAIEGCLYQNHVHRLRARIANVAPEFVMYWMQAAFLHLALYGGVGNRTTIPNLSGARLKQLPIPLPPLPEQRVSATVLAKIQAALLVRERIVATLKELKAATMAKLFREGLRDEPLKQTEIGEIPVSWEAVTMGSVCEKINYGTSVRCTADGNGRPVLRIPNIVNEKVDVTDLKWAVLPAHEVPKLVLEEGDLLFVRTNGNRQYTGRCAAYTGQPAGALFASYLIRVRLTKGSVLPSFAQAYLSSLGREQITSRATSASDGKYNIDTGVLKNVLLPRPVLAEQQAIVDVCTTIDRRLVRARERMSQLRYLFASMLYQLMTGQVRVTPEMIARARLGARPSTEKKERGAPDEGKVQEIVQRIVEAVAPEKIILFGSAARGEMGPDSDIDLLVVKACDAPREIERRIYRSLIGIGIPKDVLVVTPGHLEKHKDTIGYIYRSALREGRIIYAR